MANSSDPKNKEILIIIGNGFDLDLGLKTSYPHFINSNYFDRGTYLNQYLIRKYQINNWIDLENELKTYTHSLLDQVKSGSSRKLHNSMDEYKKFIQDKTKSISTKDHQILCNNLVSYLKEASNKGIDINSYAYQLNSIIKRLKEKLSQVIITYINFNYTEIPQLSETLHVHGSISQNNIILGFEDNVEINDIFCFMIKSHSPHFRSFNIREKLRNANEVIFFGHSLGITDYHYFSDFFKVQSGLNGSEKIEKKRIRIFTFDENARQDILIQLRNMNQK